MPNKKRRMTDRELQIAIKAGAIGYFISAGVALSSLFLAGRTQRNQIKRMNSVTTMINDFVKFVNNKPVEMSGEEFLNQACERLVFIGMAGTEMGEEN